MVISDAVTHLSDDAARRVEQAVLAGPTVPTPATLRRRLRRAVIQADPDAAVTATRVAHDTREVRRVTGSGGQDCLEVWSDPRDIHALWGQLTALAGPADTTDPRPLGARRVDALLGAVLGTFQQLPADTAGHHLPGPVPPKPTIPVQVQVVVDLPTLTGLADHPGELVGHGPVPAGVVRDWLTDATTWRRLVCDPVTGHLLDYGPTIRFAPPTLKAFLQARDQHCTFPGCRLPAQRCDEDHEPPWKPDGTGGHTSATDMAPLCRHHHNWKTHHGWQLERQPDGTNRWTSPTGRTYDVPRTPALGAEQHTDTCDPCTQDDPDG